MCVHILINSDNKIYAEDASVVIARTTDPDDKNNVFSMRRKGLAVTSEKK